MEVSSTESYSVDELLASFKEAGHLDSEGVFTIAGRRAAGKLATDLLVDSSDWILKIVQAACLAKAASLDIKQTQKATHIKLTLPYAIDLKQFENSLVQGLSASQLGINELSMALRSVGGGQNRSWAARLATLKYTHWITSENNDISIETTSNEDSNSDDTKILLGVTFPLGEVGKVGGLVRLGAAVQNEHQALCERAYACPIPLTLDGQRIDTLAYPADLSYSNKEMFLGLALGKTSKEDLISIPQGFLGHVSGHLKNSYPSYFNKADLNRSGSSIIRLSYHYRVERFEHQRSKTRYRGAPSPSRIILVYHGVIVEKENFGIMEPIVADVYFNANSMRSDLSGLKVNIYGSHAKDPLHELRSIEPFMGNLSRRLSKFQCRPNRFELSIGGGATVLGSLISWPLGLAALGASAVQILTRIKKRQEILVRSISDVEAFTQKHCLSTTYE